MEKGKMELAAPQTYAGRLAKRGRKLTPTFFLFAQRKPRSASARGPRRAGRRQSAGVSPVHVEMRSRGSGEWRRRRDAAA